MSVNTYQKTSKTKLSDNFNVSEFACHGNGCCTTVKIDSKLVEYLQKIREHFGKPITITSGYRCQKHNKNIGGATGSYHTKGQAADIIVSGVAPAKVAAYAESIGILGIGLYESNSDGYFVHIDTRTTKSFWYGQRQAYRSTFGGSTTTIGNEKCKVEIPLLRKGASGKAVKALQTLLIENGYSCGKYGADGDFGSGTYDALIKFQKAKVLTVTGKADVETWNKLFN